MNGWEMFAPLSVNFKAAPGMNLYGQTEFGNGNYTDPISGTQALTNFSDTVIGGEMHFQSFGLPAMLNVGLNLPTGDPTWEAKQIAASVPTEFVDSYYRGRGFGVSALYGLSFPAGNGEYGMAAGYMYSGAFNPGYAGLPISNLKLGDSIFLALNHVQPYSGNKSETIRLSAYYSLPTLNGSANVYQLGTNFNASYSWVDPAAFSFEVGAQYWMAGQVADTNGNWSPEANAFYGPRFYLTPSYSFGDLAIMGRLKFVLPNNYDKSNLSDPYDGGGLLGGLEPCYTLKLDASSDIKISGSFDYIAWLNVLGADGTRDANAIYNLWTFGTTYEVKL
ncbi:MAG TPA: hypothetical protein VGR89_00010 [Puia sp.]|nr:hypothetical protein [Puia sp.]